LNLETTSISTQERMSCFPSMKLHPRESKWFAVDRESKLDNESSTLPIRAEFETCVAWHVVEIPIQTTTHLMSCRFQVLALQRRIQLVAWVQCSLPSPKKHQSPVWGWKPKVETNVQFHSQNEQTCPLELCVNMFRPIWVMILCNVFVMSCFTQHIPCVQWCILMR